MKRLPWLALAMVMATSAQAQKPAPAKVEPPSAAVDAPPPPYEPQLLRLAEVMGTLAYLRDLCAAGDAKEWRLKMSAIIDADAVSPVRRRRLAGAFNAGFRGYQMTYRTCTANAELVISHFLDEGSRLTQDIGNRYGSS